MNIKVVSNKVHTECQSMRYKTCGSLIGSREEVPSRCIKKTVKTDKTAASVSNDNKHNTRTDFSTLKSCGA